MFCMVLQRLRGVLHGSIGGRVTGFRDLDFEREVLVEH